MPTRTIKAAYFTTDGGDIYRRGQTANLTADEIKRGDITGAFEPASDDDGIDKLTATELDAALIEAGIDSSSGGSLKDGSLSADEKRGALREHRNANP